MKQDTKSSADSSWQTARRSLGATITFKSPRRGYSDTTQTGPDGSFGMSVVAGMEGQLTAQLGVPQWILGQCPVLRVERRTSGIFGFMDATPITLLVTL